MAIKIKIIKKATKGAEIAPTLRQQIVKNLVEKGGIKSKGKILSAAGYSAAVQKTPQKVFDTPYIRRAVDTVISDMEQERDEIIKLMRKKRSKANYAVLSITLKNMNHDIELLNGRPTERTDEGLDTEQRKQLEDILSRNKKK